MRWHPNNDCQMYAEDPWTDFPTVGIKHRPDLSKNYPKYINSWRSGTQYETWTKWDKGPYLPGTRLREASLPIAGQMPRYLINKDKPAGFGVPKKIKFDLKEFLDWWRENSGKTENKDDKKTSKGQGKTKGAKKKKGKK